MSQQSTFLCLACELKGLDTLHALKDEGNRVLLVTCDKLKDEPWPWEAIDEVFYVQESQHCVWNMDDVIAGLAHLMRSEKIDRILAIDDFDVEKGALLREEFRIPGMGQTTCRHYRDKLAMRMVAAGKGIRVPGFSSLFNDATINRFLEGSSGPWMVKPRSEAAAAGLRKVHTAEECWAHLDTLGEERHNFLIEEFKPGNVFHVDTISYGGEVVFSAVSKYMSPPFEVAHTGGIFRSHIVEYGSEDSRALEALNKKLLQAFNMQSGVSHSEFIQSYETGEFFFLETSFRVAGAHLAEMIEAATGLNLWREWGRVETAAARNIPYTFAKPRRDYSGIVVSLTKFEQPDYSSFSDPEIVWRLDKKHHIGLVVRSNNLERIRELLDAYAERIFRDFHATAPARKTFRE